MYNQILIHFHIMPLLWMSIHCESTSRNHRTELPYEHWEQHHCTIRNQSCSLCNTNHYCQFQSLTSISSQVWAFCTKGFFAVSTFDHLVRHLAVFFAKTTPGPGTWVCFDVPSVTHRSTVVRTVMCRQDGRGRFPVLLDDHSKCRTNSQKKSQLS